MPDRVRSDLMAAAMEVVDVVDAAAHVIKRAAEIDAGIAAALMRALVDGPVGIGDKVDAADEEGEVEPAAVLVHLGGKVGQLLPALELGAIVERHDDELRRPIDAGLRRREERRVCQRRACGDKFACSQISPPTESDSGDHSKRVDARIGLPPAKIVWVWLGKHAW